MDDTLFSDREPHVSGGHLPGWASTCSNNPHCMALGILTRNTSGCLLNAEGQLQAPPLSLFPPGFTVASFWDLPSLPSPIVIYKHGLLGFWISSFPRHYYPSVTPSASHISTLKYGKGTALPPRPSFVGNDHKLQAPPPAQGSCCLDKETGKIAAHPLHRWMFFIHGKAFLSWNWIYLPPISLSSYSSFSTSSSFNNNS